MTHIKIKHISKTYLISPYTIRLLQRSLREDIAGFFLIPLKRLRQYIIKKKQKFAQQTFKENILKIVSIPKKLTGFSLMKEKNQTFFAIENISVNFKQGDTVGIIGTNGSGKSTLLKIIAGITTPTTGEIYIRGNITTLLGIGIGFHGDLTGKDNIFLSGALLGFKKKALEKEFNNIITFSGIEKFINTPVKFYSSGMYTRLAFSIATAACNTADIFLIDEVLSVGDQAFQTKSLERIKELTKNKKRIILLVSHDIELLKKICTTCLWLEKGKIKAFGASEEIINQYTKEHSPHNIN